MLAEIKTDLAYKIYVTDSLKLSGENKYITARWIDTFNPPETTDGDSIFERVVKKHGLTVTEE